MDAGDVYRRHARAVLGYLRGQGVDDPEDVLGEVFFHVARSLDRFLGDDDDLRRWLFTIARNRAVDDRRRRSRRPRSAGQAVPDRAALPADEQLDPELRAALGRLTDEQREVVTLRFVADLSLEDVARITGRSTGAVKSLQHRAMEQLARILRAPRGAVPDDD